MWRCGTRLDGKANCPDSPTLEENKLQSAVMEAISQQYIHKDETLGVTMQSIRSVLTPETVDSEYVIRTKINELQKERKTLIAKALAENDDGKYDFQFTRSSGSWSSSKPSWRVSRRCKRPRRWTKPGWRRSPPCWRISRKTASPLTTS